MQKLFFLIKENMNASAYDGILDNSVLATIWEMTFSVSAWMQSCARQDYKKKVFSVRSERTGMDRPLTSTPTNTFGMPTVSQTFSPNITVGPH